MSNKKPQPQTSKSALSKAVLSRIERDGVRPRSKLLCRCTEYTMWIMWFLSIGVGALAFTEAMYVSMHSGYEYYELTHESLTAFVLASLPIIWIVTLIIMVILSIFYVRLTKRGYRYSLFWVLGSCVLLTVVLGLVLGLLGMGKKIDTLMSEMPMPYQTVEDKQAYLWAHPEDGRITGMMTDSVGTSSDVLFTDVVDREWLVYTAELSEADQARLRSKKHVRLIGLAKQIGESRVFVACSVHPWMHAGDMPITDIQQNQIHIQENIAYHTMQSDETDRMQCKTILQALMSDE